MGTVTPCLEYFPVRVRGTQGYWRLLLKIMEDRPRTRGPSYAPLPHHHADKTTGLYTGVELQDWNYLKGFPRFSEALQGDLAQSGCGNYQGDPWQLSPGVHRSTWANWKREPWQPSPRPGWWCSSRSTRRWPPSEAWWPGPWCIRRSSGLERATTTNHILIGVRPVIWALTDPLGRHWTIGKGGGEYTNWTGISHKT